MSKAIVTISGRCGRDASPVNTPKPMARLSIPSTVYYKGEERVTWWNVTLWGKDAEFAIRNVKKGDVVQVSGEGYLSVYTDKDGVERQQACIDSRSFSKIASANPQASQGNGYGHGNSQGNGWGGNAKPSNPNPQYGADPVPF